MHGCIIGGRTDRDRRGTWDDIGSAFCTQEQWGISICERVFAIWQGKGLEWRGRVVGFEGAISPRYCI